ncbi:MAG: hypothetical protein AABX23_03290 [Nanoarchaeota archaeon]
MNKRGIDFFTGNIVYLIILILFLFYMFSIISSYSNGATYYEDFYSKEIVKIINKAEPGMEFKIDITPLANAASKNEKLIKEIISIDNVNNKVTASARIGSGTSFDFFMDFDIIDWYVESPSGGADKTRLIFKVVRKQRNEL